MIAGCKEDKDDGAAADGALRSHPRVQRGSSAADNYHRTPVLLMKERPV